MNSYCQVRVRKGRDRRRKKSKSNKKTYNVLKKKPVYMAKRKIQLINNRIQRKNASNIKA